jgi:hypothetical protein
MSGFAQPGSYQLQLWEAGRNQVVMNQRGNFINDADDAYTLPDPVALHDGRILQTFIILTILDPQKYFVSLKVTQDGQVLGSVDVPAEGPGKTDSHTLFFNLMITLKAKVDEPGAAQPVNGGAPPTDGGNG